MEKEYITDKDNKVLSKFAHLLASKKSKHLREIIILFAKMECDNLLKKSGTK